MWAALQFAIGAAFWLTAVASAAAESKYAFIVGIDAYDNLPAEAQLKKAVGDAKAMGQVLSELGYVVKAEPNISRSQFNERWQQFLDVIKPGDQVAFVFSGHGVEISGANFLLPRDVPRIRLGRDEQLKRESIAVTELLTDLRDRKPGLSLVVLDACRDNPFAEGMRAVGAPRGLARVEPPEGTFIMFSAGTNQTALDRLSDTDSDPTSIYTRTLLPHLKTPGLSLLDMADRVGEQVRDLANSIGHRQTPAFYSGVVGGRRVCLAGCESRPSADEVVRICREVAEISSIATLAELQRQHSGTSIADCISARIGELRSFEEAAAKLASELARAEELARKRSEDAALAKAETERRELSMLQSQRREQAPAHGNPTPLVRGAVVVDRTEREKLLDQLLDGLARKHGFALPPYRLDEPDNDVAAELRQFVGAWIEASGGDGKRRKLLLLVTMIDKNRQFEAYHIYGPPGKTSWDKNPAGSVKIVGHLDGSTIRFTSDNGYAHRYDFRSDGRISYTSVSTTGKTRADVLVPVWKLKP